MPKDVKVTGLQVSKIIASGSTGTGAKLLIYPVTAENSGQPNEGVIDPSIFPTGSIGSDIFMFVSGGSDTGKSAFGGSVHISGNLVVDGTTIINDTMNYFYSDENGVAKSSGSLQVSGTITAESGFSGSLTSLTDGSSYLLAGANITTSTGSNGAITIAGSPGFFISDTNALIETSGSVEITGSLTVKSGISGSHSKLADGSPYLLAGPAIILTTGSSGAITIEALTGSVGAPGALNQLPFHGVGAVLTASSNLWVDNGVSFNVTGVFNASGNGVFGGDVTAPGLSGSHTTLSDGSPAFLAEGGISLVTESNGSVTISSSLGVIDHSGLINLDANDHLQYLLTSSFDVVSTSLAGHVDDTTIHFTEASIDHGALVGLGDAADHPWATTTSSFDAHANDVSIHSASAELKTLAWMGTSQHNTVQELQNSFHSAGKWVSGSIIDNGGATITVEAGSGFIRLVNDPTGTLYFCDWGGLVSTAIPTDSVRYIGVEATGGIGNNASISIRSSYDWNFNTDFPLGSVVNESDVLHLENSTHNISDHANQMIQRLYATAPYARDNRAGGLLIGETGTRKFTMSAGNIWEKLEEFVLTSKDTSAADTFDAYYRDGIGGFTVSSSMTDWDNSSYDDNSGILAPLSTNKYANLWWYVELDDAVVMVWGRDTYNSVALAQGEGAPTTLPDRLSVQSRLVGRFVIKQGDNSAQAIETVFGDSLSSAGLTDHGALTGLADDDHPQYLLTASFNTVSSSIATDINTLETSVTTLSGATANDVNELRDDIASAGLGLWFSDTSQLSENTGSIAVSGSAIFHSGITGALNVLPDGDPAFTVDATLSVSTGSNGKITFSASALSSSVAADVISLNSSITTLSGAVATDIDTVEADIVVNTSAITALSGVAAQTDLNLAASTTALSGVAAQTDLNLASDISVNAGVITTLSGVVATDVNTNQADIATNVGVITALSGVVATDINTDQADIVVNASAITTLSGVVATDINTDQADIVINATAITTLSGVTSDDVNELRGQIAGSSAWYEITDVLVGTTSSVSTSGSLLVKSGITGALNELPDGTNAFVGSNGVTTTTGSSGQVIYSFNEEFFFVSQRNFSGAELFLADTDNNSLIFVSNSSNVDVHVPPGLADGFEAALVQQASGRIQVLASGSLLFSSDFSTSSSKENSTIGVHVSASNVYLYGDLKLLSGVQASGSAADTTFTPITNFSSSNVQDAIAEVNVISASIATDIVTNSNAITALSGVVATDVDTNQADILTNVNAITALSGVVATDILTNVNAITALSGATAADVNSFRFPPNVVDSTGIRFLSLADNKAVIEMSHATSNIVFVPPELGVGFSCVVVQAGAAQVQVQATGTLRVASTFLTASAEQWSPVWISSGSNHVLLGGDLELA